jgi:hypothetical protein
MRTCFNVTKSRTLSLAVERQPPRHAMSFIGLKINQSTAFGFHNFLAVVCFFSGCYLRGLSARIRFRFFRINGRGFCSYTTQWLCWLASYSYFKLLKNLMVNHDLDVNLSSIPAYSVDECRGQVALPLTVKSRSTGPTSLRQIAKGALYT